MNRYFLVSFTSDRDRAVIDFVDVVDWVEAGVSAGGLREAAQKDMDWCLGDGYLFGARVDAEEFVRLHDTEQFVHEVELKDWVRAIARLGYASRDVHAVYQRFGDVTPDEGQEVLVLPADRDHEPVAATFWADGRDWMPERVQEQDLPVWDSQFEILPAEDDDLWIAMEDLDIR